MMLEKQEGIKRFLWQTERSGTSCYMKDVEDRKREKLIPP